MAEPLARAVSKSANRKLGLVATTHAAQTSCPTTCPFLGQGCYAERGPLGAFTTRRLNAAAVGRSALEVAIAESDAIDTMDTVVGRPLRLHTVGDCSSDESAGIVSVAAERYSRRGGGRAWTYTHAWRTVRRGSWGSVAVLASCETPTDVEAAHARGYATALVVPSFRSWRRYNHGGVDLLPCPEMTGATRSCADCRLCFDDARLHSQKLTIGFAVHGDVITQRRAQVALERRRME